jgi:hypothetical protein
METMFTTTQLKLVSKTDKFGEVWIGYQQENQHCITYYKYPDGKARVLVTHGKEVICEFDIPNN